MPGRTKLCIGDRTPGYDAEMEIVTHAMIAVSLPRLSAKRTSNCDLLFERNRRSTGSGRRSGLVGESMRSPCLKGWRMWDNRVMTQNAIHHAVRRTRVDRAKRMSLDDRFTAGARLYAEQCELVQDLVADVAVVF